jgi:hypothetical protein
VAKDNSDPWKAGVGFIILGVLAILGIIEIPTGDMTMTDVARSNNKGMEMKDEMNMGTGMNLGKDVIICR